MEDKLLEEPKTTKISTEYAFEYEDEQKATITDTDGRYFDVRKILQKQFAGKTVDYAETIYVCQFEHGVLGVVKYEKTIQSNMESQRKGIADITNKTIMAVIFNETQKCIDTMETKAMMQLLESVEYWWSENKEDFVA